MRLRWLGLLPLLFIDIVSPWLSHIVVCARDISYLDEVLKRELRLLKLRSDPCNKLELEDDRRAPICQASPSTNIFISKGHFSNTKKLLTLRMCCAFSPHP